MITDGENLVLLHFKNTEYKKTCFVYIIIFLKMFVQYYIETESAIAYMTFLLDTVYN